MRRLYSQSEISKYYPEAEFPKRKDISLVIEDRNGKRRVSTFAKNVLPPIYPLIDRVPTDPIYAYYKMDIAETEDSHGTRILIVFFQTHGTKQKDKDKYDMIYIVVSIRNNKLHGHAQYFFPGAKYFLYFLEDQPAIVSNMKDWNMSTFSFFLDRNNIQPDKKGNISLIDYSPTGLITEIKFSNENNFLESKPPSDVTYMHPKLDLKTNFSLFEGRMTSGVISTIKEKHAFVSADGKYTSFLPITKGLYLTAVLRIKKRYDGEVEEEEVSSKTYKGFIDEDVKDEDKGIVKAVQDMLILNRPVLYPDISMFALRDHAFFKVLEKDSLVTEKWTIIGIYNQEGFIVRLYIYDDFSSDDIANKAVFDNKIQKLGNKEPLYEIIDDGEVTDFFKPYLNDWLRIPNKVPITVVGQMFGYQIVEQQ